MHLARLIGHLDAQTFKITLFLSRSNGQYEWLIPKHVHVVYLSNGKIKKGILGLLQTISPLAAEIKKLSPHIFFSIMDHANVVSYFAHRRAKSKSRLAFGIQTPILQGLKFQWNPFNKLISLLIPKIYPRADLIVALSKGVRQDLISLERRLGMNTIVINNIGIDPQQNPKTEPILKNPEKTVLMVCGRLIRLKGFDLVIQAMALVQEKYDCELWILGEGPEEENLRDLADRLTILDDVKFMGFKDSPMDFMKAADIFILSSYYEGFGNVIVEAMAAGTPVIATDCPYGPGEIISDGVDGIIVPVGDHKSMAKAIAQLIENRSLRNELSANGLKRSGHFTGEVISSHYKDAFVSLIK